MSGGLLGSKVARGAAAAAPHTTPGVALVLNIFVNHSRMFVSTMPAELWPTAHARIALRGLSHI